MPDADEWDEVVELGWLPSWVGDEPTDTPWGG